MTAEPVAEPTTPRGVTLRVHQGEALAALAAALAAGKTRAWVALPPGAGKTLVGLMTVRDRVAAGAVGKAVVLGPNTAIQGQNLQVASGVLNQPPVESLLAFQVSVQTQGRLSDPAEFGNIVVKQSPGAVVRLRNVARIELAAQDYGTNSYLDRDPAVAARGRRA